LQYKYENIKLINYFILDNTSIKLPSIEQIQIPATQEIIDTKIEK
jgi:hypothetical protein